MKAIHPKRAHFTRAGKAATPAKAQAAALSIQSTLATHYDGASYTGSSFSVLGVNCLGGYVNMSASWDNRVSSTYSSFCPRVRHWTGVNLSGQYQDTDRKSVV